MRRFAYNQKRRSRCSSRLHYWFEQWYSPLVCTTSTSHKSANNRKCPSKIFKSHGDPNVKQTHFYFNGTFISENDGNYQCFQMK